jgi:hypothetical protein
VSTPAAFRDQPVHDLVEHPHRAAHLQVARQWPVVAELQRRAQIRLLRAHAELECLGDHTRVTAHVGAEHRAARDRERHLHHLLRDVEPLAVAPARELLDGLVDHHLAVLLEPLWCERRREQLAVPLVRVALGEQQAIAEHRPQELQAGGLLERGGLRDQDLMGEVRVGHDVDRDVREHDARDRAGARRAVLQREPIAAELQQVADQRQPGDGRYRRNRW